MDEKLVIDVRDLNRRVADLEAGERPWKRDSNGLVYGGNISVGGDSFSNVRIGVRGLVTSDDNAFGMYLGGLTLRPASGWNAFGFYTGGFTIDTSLGDVTGYGGFIESISKSGANNITTLYGLRINNVTAGTTNYAIYTNTGDIRLMGATTDKLGFHGATPAARQTVTGSRGGNAALTSLLTALATIGLITNSTSA